MHVQSWQKFNEIINMMESSLQGIVDRWADGKVINYFLTSSSLHVHHLFGTMSIIFIHSSLYEHLTDRLSRYSQILFSCGILVSAFSSLIYLQTRLFWVFLLVFRKDECISSRSSCWGILWMFHQMSNHDRRHFETFSSSVSLLFVRAYNTVLTHSQAK